MWTHFKINIIHCVFEICGHISGSDYIGQNKEIMSLEIMVYPKMLLSPYIQQCLMVNNQPFNNL